MQPRSSDLNAIQDEASVVLTSWQLKPGEFQVVGLLPGMQGSISRPIIEIANQRYVLRRQPPDLTENDTQFRHTYMRHLTAQGLPVPPLLPRPDGTTYAVAEEGIYELQGWLDGQPYLSDGPASDERVAAAAAMLGRLHQASGSFQWQPHIWPAERSGYGMAQAYCELIQQATGQEGLPDGLAYGLRRVAEACRERISRAAETLARMPGPPMLTVHGDYQPHNLTFEHGNVCAIYDFDAARYDQRLLELAYALVYFTGARWDDAAGLTPPLVDDGLDILRVNTFLTAYGQEAPPAEGEAQLLGDAITLVFPIFFANGAAEDLIFPQDFDGPLDEEDALARLEWADTFWLWLDRFHSVLAQTWETGAER